MITQPQEIYNIFRRILGQLAEKRRWVYFS